MNDFTPTTAQVREAYAEHDAEWAAAFDRWLAAHDRETAARAWDEGRTAGYVDAADDRDPESPNPYREDDDRD